MLTPIRKFDPEQDYFQGFGKPAIKVIEYGDFSCPYSAMVYPEIKYLQDSLGNQLCRHSDTFLQLISTRWLCRHCNF